MDRLLLTGASGFLGTALLPALAREFAVTPMSRQARGNFVAADLTDAGSVKRVLQETRPDVVVHAAAFTSVDECERDQPKAYEQNVRATAHLVAACRDLSPAPKFIYVSTDQMYDGAGPHAENGPVLPRNVYALTKLWAEDVALRLPGALVLRSNFFARGAQPGQGLAAWLLKAIAEHQPITLFDDVLFNPLYASDYVELLIALIRRDATGIVNLGAAGPGMSKAEFAHALAGHFGLTITNAKIGSVDSMTLPAKRPKDMRMNVDLLARLLLDRSLPTIESGMQRMWHDTGAAHA